MAPWWLAAVQLINPSSSMLANGTWSNSAEAFSFFSEFDDQVDRVVSVVLTGSDAARLFFRCSAGGQIYIPVQSTAESLV